MKGVIAFAIGVLTTHSIAMADYDEANCYTNTGLKNTELACVTCGVQKFMDKKGVKGYPSERWIAMLATTNRAYLDANGESVVRNPDVRARMQKVLAMQLQSYGFCTSFDGSRGKNTQKSSDDGFRDMTPSQWNNIYKLLTDATPGTATQMDEFAEDYGFTGAMTSKKAGGNLKILVFGDKDESSDRAEHRQKFAAWQKKPLFQRRAEFRDRLEKALNKDSVISDGNLRGCLQNVLSGLEGRNQAKAFQDDADAYELCQTIHKSCDIEEKDDYCYTPGMQLKKPVATQPKKPVSAEPYKPGKGGSSEPSTLPAPPPLPDPGFQQR